MKKIRFDILTIFPEMFASVAGASILKRAIQAGRAELILHDIRQYADDAHRSVDDVPYGGGAGMVMKGRPVIEAVRGVEKVGKRRLVVLLTPQGTPLTQKAARDLAAYNQIVLVCGRYEGIDQRVRDTVIDREISVGDYVLTGGELPALVVCDVVARLVEGVLGNSASHRDESFENSRLEYPQYTRPADYKGMKVPEVLLTGHHKKIEEWREKEAYLKTKRVRPDLITPTSPPPHPTLSPQGRG